MTVGGDVRIIEKVTRVVNLYDLYGALLTERQREMMEMYYFEDWSLAEVAENLGVSRQAVHDNIRRAEEQLESYEHALSLLKSNEQVSSVVLELEQVWTEMRGSVPAAGRKRIESLLQSLAAALQITLKRGDDRA